MHLYYYKSFKIWFLKKRALPSNLKFNLIQLIVHLFMKRKKLVARVWKREYIREFSFKANFIQKFDVPLTLKHRDEQKTRRINQRKSLQAKFFINRQSEKDILRYNTTPSFIILIKAYIIPRRINIATHTI